MAKKKKDVEEVAEADTNKGPLPEDNADASGEDTGDAKGEVTVKYRDHVGGVQARTFSAQAHGKDFKKLADEFRTKHAARIVK